MKFVLAGDVGPAVGLGHRRRLEAVGTALARMGHESTFVAVTPPGDTDVLGPDLVVVDSYLTRADDQSLYPARLVAAIDEMGRGLDVDLVIDPTPGARTSGYSGTPRRVFAGAAYAIVAPDFAERPRPPRPRVERVLVTLGASRAGAPAPALAAAVAARHPGLRVQLAIGPWLDAAVIAGVEVVDAPHGLGELIRDADIVVTAGGVTLLEACASARATVSIPIAENQHHAVNFLVRAGATVRSELETAPEAIGRLIDDANARQQLGRTARTTIDGAGATRVAGALIELAENGR